MPSNNERSEKINPRAVAGRVLASAALAGAGFVAGSMLSNIEQPRPIETPVTTSHDADGPVYYDYFGNRIDTEWKPIFSEPAQKGLEVGGAMIGAGLGAGGAAVLERKRAIERARQERNAERRKQIQTRSARRER